MALPSEGQSIQAEEALGAIIIQTIMVILNFDEVQNSMFYFTF